MERKNSDLSAAFIYKPGQSLGYLIRDGYRVFTKVLHEDDA